ncbi:MAG: hypothetical protein AAGK23_10180 [Pseudomonadota bacterium]
MTPQPRETDFANSVAPPAESAASLTNAFVTLGTVTEIQAAANDSAPTGRPNILAKRRRRKSRLSVRG